MTPALGSNEQLKLPTLGRSKNHRRRSRYAHSWSYIWCRPARETLQVWLAHHRQYGSASQHHSWRFPYIVLQSRRCLAVNLQQNTRMLLKRGIGNEKMKTGKTPNLNPSPINDFITNSLFCFHFSFSQSLFPVIVASQQNIGKTIIILWQKWRPPSALIDRYIWLISFLIGYGKLTLARKLFVNDKITASCPPYLPLEYCIKGYKQQKLTLKKCWLQVFNTQNEFESSTNLSTRALFCICCVIYTIFYVMIVYFYISLRLVVVPTARLLMNIVT